VTAQFVAVHSRQVRLTFGFEDIGRLDQICYRQKTAQGEMVFSGFRGLAVSLLPLLRQVAQAVEANDHRLRECLNAGDASVS